MRNRPPNSAVLVMVGGMLASVSQAPVFQQPLHHPAEHSFHRRATCHGATSLAASLAVSPLEVPQARLSTHTRPVSTGRPDLASFSGQVATAPSPAWLRVVSHERCAVEAKLSPADPHDE